jgi:hypothetical protein
MGLPPFGGRSSSSFDTPGPCTHWHEGERRSEPAPSPPPRFPNPEPSHYDILRSEQVGRFLIIMLRYPDCTNYEGVKISVYCDCTLKQLKAQKRIDPHFAENKKYHSPIARFEPTQLGWNMARLLCVELTRKRP